MRRWLAFAVDYLVIVVWVGLLALLFTTTLELPPLSPAQGHLLGFAGSALIRAAVKLLPWELSHALLWRIPGWPAPEAPPPTWIWIGFAAVWLLVMAHLVMPFLDPRRRALYDVLADSVVVRGEPRST